MAKIIAPRLSSLPETITLEGFRGIDRNLNGEAKFETLAPEEKQAGYTPQVLRVDYPQRTVRKVLPGIGWSPLALQKGVRLWAQIEVQQAAASRANPVQTDKDGKPVEDADGKPVMLDTRIGDAGAALALVDNISEILALYYIYDSEKLFMESTYAQRVEQFDNNVLPLTEEQVMELAADFFEYMSRSKSYTPASSPARTLTKKP